MPAAVPKDFKVYEVKVFDRSGKLKKVISRKSLAVRAEKKFHTQMFSGGYRKRNNQKSSRA